MAKVLFLIAAVSVTLLMLASIVNAADNVTTTTGNVTQTTISPATTAPDFTAAPSVASSTAAPAAGPTNPPPAPTTKAPMAPATTTVAGGSPTTAPPSATILITLKEASYGATEAARIKLVQKLAGMLNIEPSLITASVDPSDSTKLIVTLRPSGNASAAQLATKAEDLSATELSALGAAAIVGTTPMPSPTPESGAGFPAWAIAVVAGSALLLLVVGVVIYKNKAGADASNGASENTLSRYETEAELRTARNDVLGQI